MTFATLPPIHERPEDFEALEDAITKFFREVIYAPLLRAIGAPKELRVTNSFGDDPDEMALIQAIGSGKIRFYRGHFRGSFNSKISRALKTLGADRNKGEASFQIPFGDLPDSVQQAIKMSESRFQKVAKDMSELLSKIIPEQVTDQLDLTNLFDRSIFRCEKRIHTSFKAVKALSIPPDLSAEARARIAAEYSKTIHLPIQDFIKKETEELRARVIERSFAGYRYETLVAEIEKSYGVSQRKAKFLARQETSLLMAKFKQVRYQEAGSDEYIWGCVAGSANHPVRHYHLLNKGKKFRWDTGAPINAAGDKKNPGQDYNCRCFPRPIVRF